MNERFWVYDEQLGTYLRGWGHATHEKAAAQMRAVSHSVGVLPDTRFKVRSGHHIPDAEPLAYTPDESELLGDTCELSKPGAAS